MNTPENLFGFGLEAEYLVLDKDTGRALFCNDLDTDDLLSLVESIPVSDIGSEGFNIKPLHHKAIPYLIEGYTLTDDAFKPVKLLPKGIEVRTPITHKIDESVELLRELTRRLSNAVSARGWALCSISHHPQEADFEAKRNYRRDDYWHWALTATTTYGPDVNISVPNDLAQGIDRSKLEEKINYYLPPLVALTFASPFEKGKIWTIDGQQGYSVRTFKRSLYAPLFYVHTEPALRFEFKGFEMPLNFEDYEAFFLVCLTILLDSELTKTAGNDERIEHLRRLAKTSLSDQDRKIAQEVIHSAIRTATKYGFDSSPLKVLQHRIDNNICPATEMIESYRRYGNIEAVLRDLTVFSRETTAKELQLHSV